MSTILQTVPSHEIFTFLTVYYKYGEYGSEEFETLRGGLQAFLDQYIRSDLHEAGVRRQQLETLPDEKLLTEVLKIGSERIDNQVGHGLVAVVKGPRSRTETDSCVYLEVYYKHGEWSVSEGSSSYIDKALDELEREMEKDGELEEWENMSEEDQEDAALERCQQNVDNDRGWGAVMRIPGRLVASMY